MFYIDDIDTGKSASYSKESDVIDFLMIKGVNSKFVIIDNNKAKYTNLSNSKSYIVSYDGNNDISIFHSISYFL